MQAQFSTWAKDSPDSRIAQAGRTDTWLTGFPHFASGVNQRDAETRGKTRFSPAQVDTNRENLSTKRKMLTCLDLET